MKRLRKLGVIIPSANSAVEFEFPQVVPNVYSLHFARIRLTADTRKQILGLAEHVPDATQLLVDAGVDVVAFACTSGSFMKGADYDKKIIKLIKRRGRRLKATTTSTAVLKALKKLNIKKLSVATPYPDWINRRLQTFVESHGVKVISIRGIGVTRDVAAVPDTKIHQLVEKTYSPEADGIFISCTDLITLHMINRLEREFRVPVVTSNQATLWDMLNLAGFRGRIKGYGVLLEKHLKGKS
ncbi:MAG: aspartate/glutamate racemase family protein [Candidatus Caldarchaeum sp.]|nr:aspartate/glutamate racemase family protein [Candidatus Caldarchaeum sp.]